MTIPERIREAARLACEPARTELRRIADELEREQARGVMDDQRAEERQ